jgi:ABC-2 type transport system permease protein
MKNAFAWSVRREIWEHRSVWIVPLAVAALVLVAFLLGMSQITGHFAAGGFKTLPPEKQQLVVVMPYGLTASVILVAALLAGVFYCLDALHGERRDRSILFWKSMPVSDRTTVLSKAILPIAVIPAIALGVAIVTQAILLGMATVMLKAHGIDPAVMYDRLPIFAMTVSLIYGVAVHALWFAPLYALMLMVSAMARRPFLWIVIPVIVVQVLEKIAFGTNHIGAFLKYRVMGAMTEAFAPNAMRDPITSLSQLEPARFFSTPGLWLGLLAAAAFLFVAIRLRRSREPL